MTAPALYTRRWMPDSPPRAVVVIAHGYAEHSGRYAHLAAYLADRGFAVYAHDHRGHGQSTTRDRGYFDSFIALVDDYADLVARTAADHPDVPLFLLGHSMGGLIVLYTLLRFQDRLPSTFRGAITNGALLDVGSDLPAGAVGLLSLIGRIAPHFPISRIDSHTVSRDPAVVAAYIADPLNGHDPVTIRVASEFMRAVRFVRANAATIRDPLLMMHGGQDQLVKPSGTQFVYKHIASTDKALTLWDGLAHECFNEPERQTVMEKTAAWIESRLEADST